MKRNYQLNYRLIACIVLSSLLLQSCNHFTNLAASTEKDTTSVTPSTLSPTSYNVLPPSQSLTQDGLAASFYQQEEELEVRKEEKFPALFRKTSAGLLVYPATDMESALNTALNKKAEKGSIKEKLATNRQIKDVDSKSLQRRIKRKATV